MRYLLVGNYGVGNLGDEALKEYFLTAFPEVEWVIVGVDVPRLPLGLRSLFRPWWKTIRALRQSDGVVFGGGSLFTDVESVFACLLWWWHAIIARLFGKPVLLAFQGIGPFRTRLGEWCARSVVRRAEHLSVRDPISFSRVNGWYLNTEIVQTFDPIFSLIEGKKYNQSSQNVFIIIPRHNSGETFVDRAREVLTGGQWKRVRILSLQPADVQEKRVCDRLREALGDHVEVVPISSIDQLAQEVAQASFVLSQRYHGALVAAALESDVEICAQGSADKLQGLEMMVQSWNTEALLRLVEEGTAALRGAL